ncbi:MAG TPA: ATPase, T2SS/T4P/T4SS family [Candidatus Acidoferrales bacterium]|nr:ATPase, T2SS/T4P/T4SS family [Candidatus Acidoferrales bacterium]
MASFRLLRPGAVTGVTEGPLWNTEVGHMKNVKRKRLGESLQERGKISHQDLALVIKEQSRTAILLGELLLKKGLVSKGDLITSLEEVTRIQYVDASTIDVSSVALKLVPGRIARRFCALPTRIRDHKLEVVMLDPHDLPAMTELCFVAGMDIAPKFGLRKEIDRAIEKHYPKEDSENGNAGGRNGTKPKIEFIATTSNQRTVDAIREAQAEMMNRPTPAVRLFSEIVIQAAARRASDIHIDPHITGPIVRIRVDGILRDFAKIPLALQNALISRIKTLADMDIAERQLPQDGRLLVGLGEERRDLRISTLPTQYGEKVVIRLLDGSPSLVHMQGLGLWQEQADLFGHLLKQPQGMILVTGPTGSGKTTTLYSALNILRSRSLNIITVEDPVEYQLEGVNQVQVDEKVGRTYAVCLRSILRQDPNVILVGEIRDAETAEMALRAAQTGHMVLSTMHTQDSISGVARLMDLNVTPFMASNTLSAVIAQRLIRRLCECRNEAAPSRDYIHALEETGIQEPPNKMYIPSGCAACDNTGYKGRVGIYEILLFDDAVNHVVRENGSPVQIRKVARASGMRSMQEDGVLKVSLGITSLEEVMRVITFGIGNNDSNRTRAKETFE